MNTLLFVPDSHANSSGTGAILRTRERPAFAWPQYATKWLAVAALHPCFGSVSLSDRTALFHHTQRSRAYFARAALEVSGLRHRIYRTAAAQVDDAGMTPSTSRRCKACFSVQR